MIVLESLSKAIEIALKNSAVKLIKYLFNGFVSGSYWICLISCLISLILYIAGQRKAGKYVSISFIVYVILQALKGALL